MAEKEKISQLRAKRKAERIRQLNKIYLCILVFELFLVGLLIYGFHSLNKKEQAVIPQELLVINEGDKAAIYVEDIPVISDTNVIINEEPVYATLTVIGDVMMHQWQIERSYDSETDTFDVSDSFEYIKKYLCDADMTIANLETTLAGRYNGYLTDFYGYSDFPLFNSPEVLADTLKDIGVDFLQTTNNHALDSGEDGLYATIDYLDSLGLMHTGTFKTKEDSDELCIVKINGITFGFVAYTYATNGISLPEDAPYCINTLDNYDDEKLEELYAKVRALDEAGVDFVCPLLHFGTEYSEAVDSWQEKVVDGLFEAGADVIFGGHPHVVQPMDVRTITNSDGSTRTGYVIYSMGNFVSSQIYDGVNKDLGIITDFTFSKQQTSEGIVKKVEKITIEPTYVYWNSETIGVVPVLESYNNPENFDFLSSKDWGRIEFAHDYVIELLMEYGNLEYTEEDNRYVITPKTGVVSE
jgi:poly-gamma-glutamate synthesis protein (capsule biosynthesis protein)